MCKSFIRKGFTLIELLFAIAIISILAGIFLPVLQKARDKAKESLCFNNLKQIGYVTANYTEDNQDFVPPSVVVEDGDEIGWSNLFANFYNMKNEKTFQCPAFTEDLQFYNPSTYSAQGSFDLDKCSYIMNTINKGKWNGADIGGADPEESTGWGANSEHPIKFLQVKNPDSKIYIVDCIKRPSASCSTTAGWNSHMKGIVKYIQTDHGPLPTVAPVTDTRSVGNHHNYNYATYSGTYNAIYGDTHVGSIRNSNPMQWCAVPVY